MKKLAFHLTASSVKITEATTAKHVFYVENINMGQLINFGKFIVQLFPRYWTERSEKY